MLIEALSANKWIYHELEGGIEKSVPGITVWIHEACYPKHIALDFPSLPKPSHPNIFYSFKNQLQNKPHLHIKGANKQKMRFTL